MAVAKIDQGKRTGLMFPGDQAATEKRGLEFADLTNAASFAVSNVSLANRVTPDDNINMVNHVVITLVQKRGVRFKKNGKSLSVDEKRFFVPDKIRSPKRGGENHIIFRGGCTLIFDLDALRLRYAIKKDIDDRDRIMPLALDQKVGAVVWSPLGWGALDRQDSPRTAAALRAPQRVEVGPPSPATPPGAGARELPPGRRGP